MKRIRCQIAGPCLSIWQKAWKSWTPFAFLPHAPAIPRIPPYPPQPIHWRRGLSTHPAAGGCRGGMDGDDWGILGMGGDAQDRPAPHLIIFLNFFWGAGQGHPKPGGVPGCAGGPGGRPGPHLTNTSYFFKYFLGGGGVQGPGECRLAKFPLEPTSSSPPLPFPPFPPCPPR